MKVKFRDWYANVRFAKYATVETAALELVMDNDPRNPDDTFPGELVAVASVNIPYVKPQEGYVFIKDWGENKGILKTLIDAGILEDTGFKQPTGFVEANLCKILKRE